MGLLLRPVVWRTVELHDELRANANEVADKWADRHLPAELRIGATIPQASPQDGLGKRHVMAQMPRVCQLTIGEAPHIATMINQGGRGRKLPHPPLC